MYIFIGKIGDEKVNKGSKLKENAREMVLRNHLAIFLHYLRRKENSMHCSKCSKPWKWLEEDKRKAVEEKEKKNHEREKRKARL